MFEFVSNISGDDNDKESEYCKEELKSWWRSIFGCVDWYWKQSEKAYRPILQDEAQNSWETRREPEGNGPRIVKIQGLS